MNFVEVEQDFNHNLDQTPFVSLKGTINLIKDTKFCGKVSLDEVEPISNQTFSSIIKEAFDCNKSVIIGRMQTRDRIQYKRCFYHCFYAPNLIKLLFKTPFLFSDDTLISRYHPTMPLTVKNPLTNEIIVGEVEFYLLDKQSQNIE